MANRANIGLIAASVLFSLLALEVGCRILRGGDAPWVWKNDILAGRIAFARDNQAVGFVPDPLLGYVQRSGHSSGRIHYDADGYRLMPPLPANVRPGLVLATGDSFTQGDEVDDEETWPAHLQGLLNRRVVNAGAGGYGIDQSVLRTEQLARKLAPSLIVIGFIADDLRRAEMSRAWGAPKPYFDLKDGKLDLRNVPVPKLPDPRDTLDFWQWAFGWSVALDMFLEMKGWRYEWVVDHERATPRGTGEKIACLLMERLAALAIPVLVVGQYDVYVWQDAEFGADQHRQTKRVLACARAAGLMALDVYEATERAVKAQGLRAVYHDWHPSPLGYRLIAEQIAAALR